MIKNLDILLIKVDAFDSEGILDSVKLLNKTFATINFNPKKGIYVGPNNIGLKTKSLSSMILTNINNKIYYLIFPLIFIIDYIKFYIQIFKFVSKFTHIKNVYCDNTFLSLIIILLKKLNKISSFSYASHDWLPYEKQKKIWSFFGTYSFIFFDYIVCNNSNYIFNHTSHVMKLRNKYWKNKFKSKSYIFKPPIKFHKSIISSNNIDKNLICFAGLAKDFEGFLMLLNSIKKTDYRLLIIGKKNEITQKLSKYCDENDLSHKLEITDYVSREKMQYLISVSFIGVNVTTKKSYTDIVLPSKLFDYLSNFKPCIVSSTQLVSSDIINKNKLGISINNKSVSELTSAITKISSEYDNYVQNISKFHHSYSPTNFSNFFI